MKLLFTLILLFCVSLGFAQKTKLDRDYLALQKPQHDTSRVLLLLDIASAIIQKKDSCLFYLNKAMVLAQKINDEKGIFQASKLEITLLFSKGLYDSCLIKVNQLLKYTLEKKNLDGEAFCYNQIGLIHKLKGKHELAINSYYQALRIYEKLNNKNKMGSVYNGIAVIYAMSEDFEKSITIFFKAAELRKESKDTLNLAITFSNIGASYHKLHQLEKAAIYYRKAVDLVEKIKLTKQLFYPYTNLGELNIERKQYDSAIYYISKATILVKSNNILIETLVLNKVFAKYYNSRSLYDSAYFFAKKTNVLAKELNNIEQIVKSAEQLAIAAAGLNKFQEAYLAHNEFKFFEDSLKNDTNRKKILAQEFQYKEEKIILEQEKQKLAYQAELAEQKRVQYTYMGVAGMFLTVLLLGAIVFKQKQKANKLLALQNEEIKKQQLEIAEKNDGLNQANEELQQQQEELLVLNENLENQRQTVENSHRSLDLLREIGREINRSLDVKQIIHTVYYHVNALMKVEGFGIGLYNEQMKCLDFEGYIEKGEELEFHQDFLTNDNLLSAFCFNQQEEIIINNFDVEHRNYIKEYGIVAGEQDVKSLIYLPLNNEGQKVGVITVQSFENNAYQDYHVSMLAHIANYTASALQKADSFRFISQQKRTLETTYEKLKLTTEQLDKSIQYASHVQSVVMPEEKELRNFFSDLFVLFRPKDIVSGDFYWFSRISDDTAVFSLSDCTGHGVPGAFMSMLGSTILHETVNVKMLYDDPALILKNVHDAIRKILKQDEKKNNDGMDISLCVFTKNKAEKNVKLTFAGAKSVLSYIIDGEIYDLKGDKQYLGGEVLQHDFTNHHLTLPEKTSFYFYTDGYQDQNNPERKRIGSKTFKAELLTCADHTFKAQKSYLENILDEHQESAEQRDDISVIGLRI